VDVDGGLVEMDVTGWDGVDWVHVVQGKVQMAGCCEYGNELAGYTKPGELLGASPFSLSKPARNFTT